MAVGPWRRFLYAEVIICISEHEFSLGKGIEHCLGYKQIIY